MVGFTKTDWMLYMVDLEQVARPSWRKNSRIGDMLRPVRSWSTLSLTSIIVLLPLLMNSQLLKVVRCPTEHWACSLRPAPAWTGLTVSRTIAASHPMFRQVLNKRQLESWQSSKAISIVDLKQFDTPPPNAINAARDYTVSQRMFERTLKIFFFFFGGGL